MTPIALAQTASFIPILQIILPLPVEGLDAANKGTLLGSITGVGALLVLFVLAGILMLIGSFIVQPIKSVL